MIATERSESSLSVRRIERSVKAWRVYPSTLRVDEIGSLSAALDLGSASRTANPRAAYGGTPSLPFRLSRRSAEMSAAEAVAPVPLAGDDGLHVVFGAGQVGRVLAALLAERGLAVRVVSRRRPAGLAEETDWRGAEAADPDAASDAAKGAAVIYQCLNAPYAQWPERFPPLQRGVLAAAERAGALLVSLENLSSPDRIPGADSPMNTSAPRTAPARSPA